MSDKDYMRIAAALKRSMPGMGFKDYASLTAQLATWRRTTTEIANVLAADDPRFDRARFYKACEMKD